VSVPLYPNSGQILRRLRQEEITALYHFTSIENLRLIREMGALCSKFVLETAHSWPCPEPGGNNLSHSLDSIRGNLDKVSVSFSPYMPMVYHKKRSSHLCFFILKVEVATHPGVLFTDRNAASTQGQRRAAGLSGLDLVDFRAFRSHRPWDRAGWIEPVQAEVLIPGKVPLGDVREVVFARDASLQEGERVGGCILFTRHTG
jgi:ssDNA thymidine ADP-ribosyltransferase DarT-like protein